MLKFLKKYFGKKEKPIIKEKFEVSAISQNNITFPDLNLINIRLVVRTVHDNPVFFITDDKDQMMYALDTDMTLVLEAILHEFNKNGNIDGIETIIKGIK